MSVTERRARLALRHRLANGHEAADVDEVASSMVALHGTDPATVYLSAMVRTQHMTVPDMDDALYRERSVVKHLAMRRTLFVFPRQDLGIAQAGASNRVAERERRNVINQVEKAGVHKNGARWLDEAGRQVLSLLDDGREATFSELRDEIPLLEGTIPYGVGKSWGGEVPIGPRVLTTLSAEGRIVRARNDGDWTTSRPRWALMKSWLGREIETIDESDAIAGLVERWLRRFGPGTETDLKWWLGSTLSAVRRSLSALDVAEVDLESQTGYLMADDLGPVGLVEPWAALLPGLDPTTMGWSERSWYLGDYKDQIFDSNGNAGPTVWWDGRIVGGWRQSEDGEVVTQILEDIGEDARGAIDSKAKVMSKWLEGKRVLPRFPSPLFKAS